MRYLGQRLGIAAVLAAMVMPLGCEERRQERQEREDRGRVNVDIQHPGGGTTVDIEYPKDKDRRDDRDHD